MIGATAASDTLPVYTANPDDFLGAEEFVELIGIRGWQGGRTISERRNLRPVIADTSAAIGHAVLVSTDDASRDGP
jgi:hypothetical protein